jgi:hypothetical protein
VALAVLVGCLWGGRVSQQHGHREYGAWWAATGATTERGGGVRWGFVS